MIPYLTRAQRGNTESPLARHRKRKRSGRTIGAMSSHIDWIITRQHLVVGKLKQCTVVRRMCVRWPCDLECGISVVAHHTRVKFECPFQTNLFDEIKPPCSVWLRYLPTCLPTHLPYSASVWPGSGTPRELPHAFHVRIRHPSPRFPITCLSDCAHMSLSINAPFSVLIINSSAMRWIM